MSEQRPTDRELLAAVEQAGPGVERGRAMFAARQAMARYRDPESAVAAGRDQHAEKETR